MSTTSGKALFVALLITGAPAARASTSDAAIVARTEPARSPIALRSDADALIVDYGERTLRWDLGTGIAVPETPDDAQIHRFAGMPPTAMVEREGRWAVSLHDGVVAFWDVATLRYHHRLPDTGPDTRYTAIALSPDGQHVAVRAAVNDVEVVEVWRSDDTARVLLREHERPVVGLVFSADGQSLWTLTGDAVERVALTGEVTTGCTVPGAIHLLPSPGGTRALVEGTDGAWLWSVESDVCTRIARSGREVGFLANGARAYVADDVGFTLWDADQGTSLGRYPASRFALSDDGTRAWTPSGIIDVDEGTTTPLRAPIEPTSAVFFGGGTRLATVSADGRVTLWDAATGEAALDLWSFTDDTWAVLDTEGRFDTADAGELVHVVWEHAGEVHPLTSIARTAYTPGLLGSWWRGETLPPPPVLRELPEPPQVRLDAKPAGEGIRVTAEVCADEGGARDLRILVDDQLVAWRDGPLDGPCTRHEARVAAPAGPSTVRIGAYAFDRREVKSETVEVVVDNPRRDIEPRRRAFVLDIGVDEYEDPSIPPLTYAVADALAMNRSLRYLRGYDVHSVVLAEGADAPATRANLRDALATISGHLRGSARPRWARELEPSGPDDLVIVTFAGHGVARGDVFHLLLEDGEVPEGELETWLRPIVAHDFALVIDACNAGASVGESFKPGPLSSRGFGQLAYDKGMLVLAASQSDEVALESDDLKQGLVTFALAREGLAERLADSDGDVGITLREWLAYATRRVPQLAGAVQRGLSRPDAPPAVVQRPRLFAYKDAGRNVVAPHGQEGEPPSAPVESQRALGRTDFGLRVLGLRVDGGYTGSGSLEGPRLQSIPVARAQVLFGGRSSGERLGSTALLGLGWTTGPSVRAPFETTPRRVDGIEASATLLLNTKHRARSGLDAVAGLGLSGLWAERRLAARVRGIVGVGVNAPRMRASPYLTASLGSSARGAHRQLGLMWLFRFDNAFDLGAR